ncbi:protein NYNRIN-like [Gossypium australe]|uniref:Protein NYNRIN-like n=1 Tax=Gossypium australe TaxID=47621 RepID=A0A5B6VJZ7_9ROSI|nr:protein NYNRIN-like [Gossypium australe]
MTFPHISQTFVSGRIIHPERGLLENENPYINAIHEEETGQINLLGIHPYEPRSVLNNWTAEEVPVVFRDYTEDCDLSPDLLRMVKQEEKQILPHEEEVENIALEEGKVVKIGMRITGEMKQDLAYLLREFKDVFVWSYQDMPGLSTDIVVHRLPIRVECKPVQQKLRRMMPDVVLKIKEEKDGKVRMCVDYRDLNKASPKDNFPLPHIDTLVDNTVGYSLFSFMDGFSGYNQIKIHPEDMEKTTFIILWGTFCYKVMPFGLKNAGATYQRAMVTLFHDMTHKEIEVYVDDMIAKSRTKNEHIEVLKKLFLRLRKFQLKLNPAKCTFRARSGKLLGSIVSDRGIEIDSDKKHNQGVWDEECQRAFDKVKQYLSNAPVLSPPNPDRPLILYLTVFNNSMGCVLVQHDELGRNEKAINYLSKKFTECEMKYLSIENLCCALIWTTRRLMQYMLYHTTWLISKLDPLKYMMESTTLNGKMARCRALEDYEPLSFDFPNEELMYVANTEDFPWKLNFDGTSNAVGNGIGAILVSPSGDHYPFTCKLDFDCTNHMAEYEACIIGIRAAVERKIRVLEVYGDSALEFDDITFNYLTRDENQMADALATLASMIKVNKPEDMRPIQISIFEVSAHCYNLEEEEKDNHPLYHDVLRYVKNREYLEHATKNDKRTLRRLASDYVLDGDILYKRRKDQVLLRCADAVEVTKILEEVHEGACGTHANGFTMARQIMRFEYYWSTMERDFINYAKKAIKVEAASYASVTKSAVSRFLKKEIICRYRMPERIISDNTLNLNNSTVAEICSQFNIKHHNSSPYRPKMNGAVEAANKNIKKIVGKMIETCKDWHEKLPFALYAYRTSVRTSTGATPFSLVYGIEAVLPIEVEIPSLRVLSEIKLDKVEWIQARYDQLNLTEEKRLRVFVTRKMDVELEGPYVVKKAFSGGNPRAANPSSLFLAPKLLVAPQLTRIALRHRISRR